MEIQYTLEALFIFGLGNWIALIIYILRFKAGKGQGRQEEGWERGRRRSETMAKIFRTLFKYE